LPAGVAKTGVFTAALAAVFGLDLACLLALDLLSFEDDLLVDFFAIIVPSIADYPLAK